MIKFKFYTCLICVFVIFYSCQNNKTQKERSKCFDSYELIGPAGKDTVNLLDCDKRKQGKWIPSPANDLKDTVFYRNDSLISGLN